MSEVDIDVTGEPPAQAPRRADFGARLAQARERRGWSINEIASRVRLSPKQVSALERMALEELPGPVFVRGFLRTYAREVGLDAAPLLDDYNVMVGGAPVRPPESAHTASPVFRAAAREHYVRPVVLGGALVLLVALGVIGAVTLRKPPASTTVATPAPVPAAAPAAAAPTGDAGKPAPAGGDATQEPPPANVSAPIAAAAEPGAAPTVSVPPATVAESTIRLTFTEVSWVEVLDASGKQLLSQNNPAGSEVRLDGKAPFQVLIGNASWHASRVPRQAHRTRSHDGPRQRGPREAQLTMNAPRENIACLPTASGAAPRRPTRQVAVRWGARSVLIGGDAPVMVQSMTNTDTADAIATAIQVKELAQAGSEVVRITVNSPEAAAEVEAIRAQLDRMGLDVPLVGDFHYNGHKLLVDFPGCAQALSAYRINPGNVGRGAKREDNFARMIEIACRFAKPVRIGVNWGSLDQELLARMMDENGARAEPWESGAVLREALVRSAIENAERAEELGLGRDMIVLSAKVSGVQDLIAVYREMSRRCDYPLHLGLTEAGMGSKGIVASTAAIGVLLQEGIGDTIRVSLTPAPGEARTKEVQVAQEILQTMGLRAFTPLVIACPGCGRTTSTFFQELADKIQSYLREQMPRWRSTYPGVESMNVAVMGCVVNGPGESKHANIGISLPGSGEAPVAPVFVDGERTVTLKGERIAEEFQAIVDDYVARKYGTHA